jgi:hypothetical protein
MSIARTLTLMIQFGLLIVSLLAVIVAVVALARKSDK